MVSGIEVVGVILGLYPLMIAASKYAEKKIHRRIVGGFHYRRMIQHFIGDITAQRALLRLHLEDLINRTQLSSSQRRDLLGDLDEGSSENWRNPEIDAEFASLLGPAKDHFDTLMTTMLGALASLVMPPLPVDRPTDETVSRVRSLMREGSDIKAIKARLRFAWEVPERNSLLQEIVQCNAKITTLKQAINTTRASGQIFSNNQIHVTFRVRDHAHKLFEVLSKSCTCEPRPLPCAKLRLRRRDDAKLGSNESCFDVRLQISSGRCRVTVNVSGDSCENIRNETRETLDDICRSVQQACSNNQSPTWAIDGHHILWSQGVRSLDGAQMAETFVTLEKCLQMAVASTIPATRRLAREKHKLSIVLAHSLPQFYGTPWLDQHWTMSSIFVLSHDIMLDPTSVQFGALLRYPYMSETLRDQRQRPAATTQQLFRTRSSGRDEYLFTLGILLLELFLGRRIPGGIEDYTSPILLLNETYSNSVNPQMSHLYFEAVKFCLWPSPDRRTRQVTFEDPGFRELYYQRVIVPLEQDLQESYGISNNP